MHPSIAAAPRVTRVLDRAFTAAKLLDDPLVVVPSSTSTTTALPLIRAEGFDVIGEEVRAGDPTALGSKPARYWQM